jgi:hypothetical protein
VYHVNAWLEKESHARPQVKFVRVDASALEDVAESEEVASVPHVVFFRLEGKDKHLERVAEVSGAKMKALNSSMNTLFGDREQRENHANMDDFLKYQINKDRVVVFLTGTPSRPRCGFSGKLIE